MLRLRTLATRAYGRGERARRRLASRVAERRASPPCSAPTARARRRCCARSRASCAPRGGTVRARRRRAIGGLAVEKIVRARHRARPRGPRRHRRAHGRGEPPPRRAVARPQRRRTDLDARLRAASRRLDERRDPASQHPLGRRAPDARDRARADGAPAAAAARRAVARTGAAIVAADHGACCATCATEQGLTVLLVEQNARSALSVADRGIVLALGRVVADDDRATSSQADDGLRHAYLGF